ncbi:MAG TPA: hypothetical protein VIR03_00435 [Candidatus Saccharimonadales bacterium]
MRYFFGFVASIGLIVLVFILVLRGFGSKSNPQSQNPLTDYANSSTVMRMTVDGPIVGDQQHQAYRITVSRDQILIETLQGYNYSPIATQTYENTQQGYTNFLRAIDLAGYTKGNTKASGQANDERGVCASGDRFIFEILSGGSQIQRYWATTCNGTGTFKGNKATVKHLFDRQVPIPDYSKLVGHLNL